MDICFSQTEARVVGCLLEKEVTTPDQYPLTLNSLTTACNQKSNRDPVMALEEADVQDTVEALKVKRIIQEVTAGFGSRVSKYQHRFCNTEFSTFQFSQQEKAVICVLLLRGPQTAGEIRTRTNRLCDFKDVREAEQVLNDLAEHPKGPFVVKLPKEPGKRDSRYMHLFSGEVDLDALQQAAASAAPVSSAASERIEALESEVEALKQEVAELKALVESLTS
ncbi:YceH family protein [Photobacterium ganghwense]|uniref:Uncharacterized protein n=1 Tax=Photobacterium ganghwense TaxID=320778 RepID=A0A0J1H8M8_9GAMM|nr:DUF480 domain-containing protein [Photobacterium ganghwense]KLV08068.1 hypothetical protein ABT57_14675 [Photobacterium ganghwense]MBV1839736.1 DUF480 domain-containing protein [Photobacterium ganghwense]PSU07187.1 DUF480 domain-containing protein [Photobacterium ganghwense]QSV15939.1 DUF480 domain-containing protein [Photobacterium ganghwense]